MSNDAQIQQTLAIAQAAIKDADDAIANLNSTLAQAQTNVAQAEAENAATQAQLDDDIVKIVQDMDEAVVQFVKDTE